MSMLAFTVNRIIMSMLEAYFHSRLLGPQSLLQGPEAACGLVLQKHVK